MNKNIEMAEKIAAKVSDIGGRAFYVGGFVRDRLMGIGCSETDCDVDIEVHNVSEEKLYTLLKDLGKPLSMGKSFGILSLKNYNIDIAMPRIEKKIGSHHRDFQVKIDEKLGTYEAAKRRDFTINSIMEDVLTGEIIDHFSGLKDIENKVIRHISDKTFMEDSLRVLRACQFAARFEFKIDESTVDLCKKIDIKNLSKERIFKEVEKVFEKSKKPSIFFRELDRMGHLSYWFKELEECKYIEQNPLYHAEGNVFEHSMMVLDIASSLKDKVEEKQFFLFAALCHDLGKVSTTKNIDGRIRSLYHEIEGIETAKTFLNRFSNNKRLIRYVRNMTKLHMRPNVCFKDQSKIKKTNKLFDESIAPRDLIYLAIADNLGRICEEPIGNPEEFLLERLGIYEEVMGREYVSGHDLIEHGIEPDEHFSELMAYAHKLRLAGIDKEASLKQTIAYAKKMKN